MLYHILMDTLASHLEISETELDSFVRQAAELQRLNPDLRVASIGDVVRGLGFSEKRVLGTILSLRPDDYGVMHKRVTASPSPPQLVKLEPGNQQGDSGSHRAQPQFITEPLNKDFQAMNLAMLRDTGRQVVIESGYRSPAYQAIVFARSLRQRAGDIAATMQFVAPPYHSQHNDAKYLAVDVKSLAPEASFGSTPEYTWMQDHAGEFGFELSFPPDNPDGVAYEPWHWRHSE